jgi:hypothetical protein
MQPQKNQDESTGQKQSPVGTNPPQGFGNVHPPADNIYLPDNPEADGTDFAHPAWWRGRIQAIHQVCLHVQEVLNGNDDGRGTCGEPWEKVRRQLLELVRDNDHTTDTKGGM